MTVTIPLALISFAVGLFIAIVTAVARISKICFLKGQWEAAESLGMTNFQVLKRAVAPQNVRIALPALANNFISLVKETSLASSVAIIEMFIVGQQIAARTYEPLIIYTQVAFVYLFMCTLLSYLQDKQELSSSKYIRKLGDSNPHFYCLTNQLQLSIPNWKVKPYEC